MNIFEELIEKLEERKKALEEEIGTGPTGGGNAENEFEYDCVLDLEAKLKEARDFYEENKFLTKFVRNCELSELREMHEENR